MKARAWVENCSPRLGMMNKAKIKVLIAPDIVEVKNAFPAIFPVGAFE